MAGASFTIDGLDRILRKLDRMAPAVEREIKAGALQKGGEIFADEARDLAPVRTGNLRSHIEVSELVKDEKGHDAVLIGPTNEAFYGIFDEFGTEDTPAEPFMRPAYDNRREAAQASVGRDLGAAVDRVAKG